MARTRRHPAAEPPVTSNRPANGEGVGLADFAGGPRRSRGASPGSALDKSLVDVRAWMAEGAGWEEAEPRHFVALYSWLHAQVYGAEPVELRTKVWFGAVSAAGKLLRDEFDADPLKLLAFLKWVWARERHSEKRAGEQERRRIGWSLQFVARVLVTDYRVSLARAGKKLR